MTRILLLLGVLLPVVVMDTSRSVLSADAENVDAEDPEVQACAKFALQSFNFFSKDLHVYTITKFFSVRKRDIGGGQYDMHVEVRRTSCAKDQLDDKPCDSCCSPESQAFHCHFVVLSATWKKQRVLIKSSCTPMTNTMPDML